VQPALYPAKKLGGVRRVGKASRAEQEDAENTGRDINDVRRAVGGC